ncbi:hypothetical protein GGR53DRAFT_453664 [Hypoxylon sp. FL1150]|nr:hypothetical protein GGR53DRAFT_453664 [Hypoxylon sp. FL1150]
MLLGSPGAGAAEYWELPGSPGLRLLDARGITKAADRAPHLRKKNGNRLSTLAVILSASPGTHQYAKLQASSFSTHFDSLYFFSPPTASNTPTTFAYSVPGWYSLQKLSASTSSPSTCAAVIKDRHIRTACPYHAKDSAPTRTAKAENLHHHRVSTMGVAFDFLGREHLVVPRSQVRKAFTSEKVKSNATATSNTELDEQLVRSSSLKRTLGRPTRRQTLNRIQCLEYLGLIRATAATLRYCE